MKIKCGSMQLSNRGGSLINAIEGIGTAMLSLPMVMNLGPLLGRRHKLLVVLVVDWVWLLAFKAEVVKQAVGEDILEVRCGCG